MLTPYRRHLANCRDRLKGQHYTLCTCPIWVYGNLDGNPIRRSLQTNDWGRAERRIQILDAGGDLAPSIPTVGISLDHAIESFLDAGKGRNLRESTLDSYGKTLAHLATALTNSRTIDSIDAPMLDQYRKKRTISAGTWRKELETLRAFFAFGVDRKWISDNPAKRLRMPKVEELTTLPFEAPEIQKLIEACGQISSDDPSETPHVRNRARALVLTLLYSGLRISDVTVLKRSSLKDQHLTVRVMKTGVPLKVLLHADAVKALTTLLAVGGRAEYFFWSGNGDAITCTKNLRRTVSRLGKLAGVHAHPHRFRDSFAVEILTNGADIRTLQLLLGHKSVRTTERHYAHFVVAHQALLDSAAATLDFSQPKSARPLLVKPLHNRKRNT